MSFIHTTPTFESNITVALKDANSNYVLNEKGEKVYEVIGTTLSKYLTDANGNYVIDPTSATGEPYIVPADMPFNLMVQKITDMYDTNIGTAPFDSAQILLDFKLGGPNDLQRTDIYGNHYSEFEQMDGSISIGFISDYTPIASFYLGAVGGGLLVPATATEIGGGVHNIFADAPNQSGEYFNNPINVINIREGLKYYQNNISTSPILDAFVNTFDILADTVYSSLHPNEIAYKVAEKLSISMTSQPGSLTSWYETVVKGVVNLLKTVVNEIAYFGQEIVSGLERLVDKLLRPDATPIETQTPVEAPSINDLSFNSVMEIEHELSKMHNAGFLDLTFYNDFTQNVSDYLVLDTYFNPSINIPAIYDGFDGLSLDPIGAFYESVTPANDPALSIADKTFVLLDSTNNGITSTTLSTKDTNRDGKLTGTELSGLNMWRDLNENGVADNGEITTLSSQNISAIRSEDYTLYTRGNSVFASAALIAPTKTDLTQIMPASNYRTLRDTDNVYYWASGGYYGTINWAANQIKINYNNKSYLIGTDGNDTFDSAIASSPFNSSLLVNFLAGGGDDFMGGSERNDNLWGGEGNDILLGYAGDDKLYGEEGYDELQGQIGNDYLDGGIGHDRLFGHVGNDVLVGGEGNDVLVGFTATNDTKQSLAAGESDNDTLYGGNGLDNLYGGFGDDYLDGGADNDLLSGDEGDDTLFGGNGDDELQGGDGNDKLLGEAGNDRIFGQTGDDIIWGGEGSDILVGFTPSNDTKQTLSAGESDNDTIYGGNGEDLILGGLGNDILFGEVGADELQGEAGNDMLYGGDGADRVFGQVGNDVLYGGDGDDLIVGFTGANETKQTLLAGESDNDYLYGGAGNDTLLGGLGNDYLDGGAGADDMQGGEGDDTYIVNSVNDTILEHTNDGYDTVISSSNYILNYGIEELRLVEGLNIHGTGNSLDNKIVGNSHNNIIDGVTGADTMIGAGGDDTYYVDNAGDRVLELANEGIDTVQSTISYTLGDNVENIVLLDFSKAEKGLVDGEAILVYGYPKMNELDYMQGDAIPDFQGTCALTAIANLLTQVDQVTSEAEVVQLAIDNSWAVTDAALPAYVRGGSNYVQQQQILESYGLRNDLLMGYNENGIANLIKSGRGVILALNAGKLWDDAAYVDSGSVNHVVTITGAAYSERTGALTGFYIADSGRQKVSDMTRYVDINLFREAANVPNAYAIYTIEPLKMWDEDIDATGNALDNTIIGNRGDNILIGGAGSDTLDGDSGKNSLYGGAGNDTYIIRSLEDTVFESANEGSDTVYASIDYALGANVENLIITGEALSASGNTLNNTLTGNNADNMLNGGAGADQMIGGAGNDTYVIDTIVDVVIENANEGTDTVQSSITSILGTNVENLTLTGTAVINAIGNVQDNVLVGNSGNNILIGGAGNDTLNGNGGRDSLYGGTGDDTYIVDSIDDIVVENTNEGIDTVQSGVIYTLNANIENLTITGTATINATGNTLNNTLIGNVANNTLNGGVGSDNMLGGLGDDTYIVDNSGDIVTENANEGIDTVQSSITYALGANVENLMLVDGYVRINGTGNELNNTLTGNGGNNTLDGGTGADTMSGGEGNDVYYVDNVDDVVIEEADALIEWSYDALEYEYFNESHWSVSDADIQSWYGEGYSVNITNMHPITDLSDPLLDSLLQEHMMMYGYSSLEEMMMMYGYPPLEQMLMMMGYSVPTRYDVELSGWRTIVVTYQGVYTLNYGNDTVFSDITYTLSADVENLILTGNDAINATGNNSDNTLTGNDADNVINGGGGNDTLNGGNGIDTLYGGTGDDIYVVDSLEDTVVENTDEGTDAVHASIDYVLGDNVENLTLLGISAINATGNTLNNTLTGNNADNILNGGTGADKLIGGTGNDSYVVDSLEDTVVENANEGADTVYASIDYALGNNIENLILSGSALSANGNALNNTLTGNSADNILDGGAGVDTMIGGAGNDTYVVDNSSDVVTENTNEGIDTVQSSVNYALRLNIENLILMGTLSIAATGNTLNNTLIGNDGNNTLNGGIGADVMIGGPGHDTYFIDNSADIVTENADEGIDMVYASVDYTLESNIENLTLDGYARINGSGNELNNTMTGNSGNNTLDGGTGADTMLGRAGSDVYYVDNVDDVIIEEADVVMEWSYETIEYNYFNETRWGVSDADIQSLYGEGYNVNIINMYSLPMDLSDPVWVSMMNEYAMMYGFPSFEEMIMMFGYPPLEQMQMMFGFPVPTLYDVELSRWETTIVTHNERNVLIDNGNDTVSSDITYTLGANVENLILTGSDAINATGNELDNTLTGNGANNVLIGGEGNDLLTGGGGNDIFLLNSMFNGSTNVDTINDFTSNEDKIYFDGSIFTNLPRFDFLFDWNFTVNSTGEAMDSDDFILFDTQTSSLYYDADGNGAEAKILVAAFDPLNNYIPSTSDFAVI